MIATLPANARCAKKKIPVFLELGEWAGKSFQCQNTVSNPEEIRTHVAAFERWWWLRLGCVDLLRNDTLCTRLAKNHSDFECFRERETTLNLRVVGSIPTRLKSLSKLCRSLSVVVRHTDRAGELASSTCAYCSTIRSVDAWKAQA